MGEAQTIQSWRLPDELWVRIQPLLPKEKPAGTVGRPSVPYRQVMEGIFYVLRTGCQWKAVPREYGSGSVVHARFQEWRQLGVFETLWEQGLQEYDELRGIAWRYQAMDGAMGKAPLGGGKNGSKPDGSWEIRYQAIVARGRTRRAAGA